MLVRTALSFILESITGSAAPRSRRIPPLDHEIGNHAVKYSAVIEPVTRQKNEIVYCLRRLFRKQIDNNGSTRRLESGGVLLAGIYSHRRRSRVLFAH